MPSEVGHEKRCFGWRQVDLHGHVDARTGEPVTGVQRTPGSRRLCAGGALEGARADARLAQPRDPNSA
jgi:hypothetical protein